MINKKFASAVGLGATAICKYNFAYNYQTIKKKC